MALIGAVLALGRVARAGDSVSFDVDLVAQPVLLEVAGELIPPLALLPGQLGTLADRLADVQPGLFNGPVGARLDTALAPDGLLSLGGERHGRLPAVLGEPVVGVASLVTELLLAAARVDELTAGTSGGLLLHAGLGEQLVMLLALAAA